MIRRYDIHSDIEWRADGKYTQASTDGDWVDFDDHEEEVAKLRAELRDLAERATWLESSSEWWLQQCLMMMSDDAPLIEGPWDRPWHDYQG